MMWRFKCVECGLTVVASHEELELCRMSPRALVQEKMRAAARDWYIKELES